MKQLFRRKRVVRVLLFLGVLFAAISITVVTIAQVRSNSIENSFDPATYGIPDTIAGYRVLAVQNLENTACMRPEAVRLVLQAPESDAESFLRNAKVDDVLQELERLDVGAEFEWEIGFVDSGATLEQLRSNVEEWNAQFGNGNCVRLGPRLVTDVPH